MEHTPMPVPKDLHLDVLGPRDVFLKEHRRIPKRAFRLALSLVQQRVQVPGLVHHAHSAPAPAESSLDDQGKTNARSGLERFAAIGDGVLSPGQGRHLELLRETTRRHLVPHEFEEFRTRPDKNDAGFGTGPRELGVFGKKTVPGMDHLDAMLLSHGNDSGDVEVRPNGTLALADPIGLVRLEPVHGEPVFLRVDGHRPEPQFGCRAHHADRYLRTVGDKNLGGFAGGRGARVLAHNRDRHL